MQTLKSFTFIVLLCGSFSVLSVLSGDLCRSDDGDGDGIYIENSTFKETEGTSIEGASIEGASIEGTCSCNEGYEQSKGDNNWTVSKKNENFTNITCNEVKSDWLTPFAIGGGIVAAGAGAGFVGYKFFRTKPIVLSENLQQDWLPETFGTSTEWLGTDRQYLKATYGREFTGGQAMTGLTDEIENPDLVIQKLAMQDYSSNNPLTNPLANPRRVNATLKFDPVSQENVVVDEEHRLFARWNKTTKKWNSVDGAERWRYSRTRGYKVIATSERNYLNPNTGDFEEGMLHARWKGAGSDYLSSFQGDRFPESVGVGEPLENLSSRREFPDHVGVDRDFELQKIRLKKMNFNFVKSDVSIAHNADKGENVLIDKEERSLAEWDRTGKTWRPVKGAKFWRYSDTYKRVVYSDSETSLFNPETEEFESMPTDNAWFGPDMRKPYLRTIKGAKLVLKGSGESIEGLREADLSDQDIDLQLNKKQAYTPEFLKNNSTVKIKFDPVSNKNILVDKDDHLLANWNDVNKEWVPAKGASRWRFSRALKYEVMSENNENFYNPTTQIFEGVDYGDAEWTGTGTEYETHENIFGRVLKGADRPLTGLEDAKDNVDIGQQRMDSDEYNFAKNKNISIKYDTATGENVIVDNQKRLMAKWNSSAREWRPADGAERWAWNKKLGYNVIAKDESGNNFLNPYTEKFEENGTGSAADWQEDYAAESSVKSTETLDSSANEITRVKIDVHRAVEYDIVDSEPRDAISPETESDYQNPFDFIREGSSRYNMRAGLNRVAEENEGEEIEMGELRSGQFDGCRL